MSATITPAGAELLERARVLMNEITEHGRKHQSDKALILAAIVSHMRSSESESLSNQSLSAIVLPPADPVLK